MWSMTWQHPIVSASIGCTSKTTVDRRQPYKWVVRRLTTHIDSSWILATEMPMVLRTPLEPGVRVRKELYKPERSWVCTLLPIYIYLTNPRGLYVTSPNVVLALSFLHYVMQVPLLRILRHAGPPPPYTTSHQRHRKMNSLHYPPPKIASSQYRHTFSQVVKW